MTGAVTPGESARLDPKIVKRLNNTLVGDPIASALCEWNGKPAMVAHTADDLAFISSGMSGRTAVAQIQHCGLTMRNPTTGILAIAGDSFELKFMSSSTAVNLAHSIATAIAETASRVIGGIQITEHERVLRSCTYLGGAYMPLQNGDLVDLVFRETALEIFAHPATVRSVLLGTLAYNDRFAIEISGPGQVTKGGGFTGGGFGLNGAVEGIAIAGLRNAITTRTSTITVLMVADDAHEAFFVNAAMVPESLRQSLSPVFVRLRQYQPKAEPSSALTGSSSNGDIVSKLGRLGELRNSGTLTEQEFNSAKAALLAGF